MLSALLVTAFAEAEEPVRPARRVAGCTGEDGGDDHADKEGTEGHEGAPVALRSAHGHLRAEGPLDTLRDARRGVEEVHAEL